MRYEMMSNGWNGYGNGGFDFFGWIVMMVALAAIVVAVILILRFAGRKVGTVHHETALEILKRRYASGEIDKQEYEEKKKELSE